MTKRHNTHFQKTQKNHWLVYAGNVWYIQRLSFSWEICKSEIFKKKMQHFSRKIISLNNFLLCTDQGQPSLRADPRRRGAGDRPPREGAHWLRGVRVGGHQAEGDHTPVGRGGEAKLRAQVHRHRGRTGEAKTRFFSIKSCTTVCTGSK